MTIDVMKAVYVSVVLYLNGFELGPGFDWDSVYSYTYRITYSFNIEATIITM